MPKVSIILAAYNSKKYISASVQSALSQTFGDIEIIIVDDSSSDGTRDVLKGFQDERVKIILLEKNLGPSGARNTAILKAKGDYLALLDHDDMWLPKKLEMQLKLFEQDNSLGMVYSNCSFMDKHDADITIGKGKRTLFNFINPKKGYVFNDLLLGNFIPTPSVIFRRAIVDDIGLFDERYKIAMDFDFDIRICRRYKVDYVDEVLFKYRWMEGVSHSRKDLALKETIDITKRYYSEIKDPSLLYSISVGKTLMHYYKELGSYNIKNAKYNDAIGNFLNAVLRYPLSPKPFYGLLLSALKKYGSLFRKMFRSRHKGGA